MAIRRVVMEPDLGTTVRFTGSASSRKWRDTGLRSVPMRKPNRNRRGRRR